MGDATGGTPELSWGRLSPGRHAEKEEVKMRMNGCPQKEPRLRN